MPISATTSTPNPTHNCLFALVCVAVFFAVAYGVYAACAHRVPETFTTEPGANIYARAPGDVPHTFTPPWQTRAENEINVLQVFPAAESEDIDVSSGVGAGGACPIDRRTEARTAMQHAHREPVRSPGATLYASDSEPPTFELLVVWKSVVTNAPPIASAASSAHVAAGVFHVTVFYSRTDLKDNPTSSFTLTNQALHYDLPAAASQSLSEKQSGHVVRPSKSSSTLPLCFPKGHGRIRQAAAVIVKVALDRVDGEDGVLGVEQVFVLQRRGSEAAGTAGGEVLRAGRWAVPPLDFVSPTATATGYGDTLTYGTNATARVASAVGLIQYQVGELAATREYSALVYAPTTRVYYLALTVNAFEDVVGADEETRTVTLAFASCSSVKQTDLFRNAARQGASSLASESTALQQPTALSRTQYAAVTLTIQLHKTIYFNVALATPSHTGHDALYVLSDTAMRVGSLLVTDVHASPPVKRPAGQAPQTPTVHSVFRLGSSKQVVPDPTLAAWTPGTLAELVIPSRKHPFVHAGSVSAYNGYIGSLHYAPAALYNTSPATLPAARTRLPLAAAPPPPVSAPTHAPTHAPTSLDVLGNRVGDVVGDVGGAVDSLLEGFQSSGRRPFVVTQTFPPPSSSADSSQGFVLHGALYLPDTPALLRQPVLRVTVRFASRVRVRLTVQQDKSFGVTVVSPSRGTSNVVNATPDVASTGNDVEWYLYMHQTSFQLVVNQAVVAGGELPAAAAAMLYTKRRFGNATANSRAIQQIFSYPSVTCATIQGDPYAHVQCKVYTQLHQAPPFGAMTTAHTEGYNVVHPRSLVVYRNPRGKSLSDVLAAIESGGATSTLADAHATSALSVPRVHPSAPLTTRSLQGLVTGHAGIALSGIVTQTILDALFHDGRLNPNQVFNQVNAEQNTRYRILAELDTVRIAMQQRLPRDTAGHITDYFAFDFVVFFLNDCGIFSQVPEVLASDQVMQSPNVLVLFAYTVVGLSERVCLMRYDQASRVKMLNSFPHVLPRAFVTDRRGSDQSLFTYTKYDQHILHSYAVTNRAAATLCNPYDAGSGCPCASTITGSPFAGITNFESAPSMAWVQATPYTDSQCVGSRVGEGMSRPACLAHLQGRDNDPAYQPPQMVSYNADTQACVACPGKKPLLQKQSGTHTFSSQARQYAHDINQWLLMQM